MLSFLANSTDSSKVKIGMRRLSVYHPFSSKVYHLIWLFC